jgi:hypothetical protein
MKVAQRPFISLFYIIIFAGCLLLAQGLAADNATDSRIRKKGIRPSKIVCVETPAFSPQSATSTPAPMIRISDYVFLSADEAFASYEKTAKEIEGALLAKQISRIDAEKKLDDVAVSYLFYTSAYCDKNEGKGCTAKMNQWKETISHAAHTVYGSDTSGSNAFYKRLSGGGSRNSQMRDNLSRYYDHVDQIITRFNAKVAGEQGIDPEKVAEIISEINQEIKDMADQFLPHKLPHSIRQVQFFEKVLYEGLRLTDAKANIDISCTGVTK